MLLSNLSACHSFPNNCAHHLWCVVPLKMKIYKHPHLSFFWGVQNSGCHELFRPVPGCASGSAVWDWSLYDCGYPALFHHHHHHHQQQEQQHHYHRHHHTWSRTTKSAEQPFPIQKTSKNARAPSRSPPPPGASDEKPHLDMDESYQLTLDVGKSSLRASSIHGLRRGMETLLQVVEAWRSWSVLGPLFFNNCCI